MNSNQRKAFTQIELILVMVVVGILAVVAIPRLAESRDDAAAVKCTQEVQQLISEISHHYAFDGYRAFSVKPIEKITNLRVGVVDGDGVTSSQGSSVSDGITYMCNGEDIVLVKGTLSGADYNLTVTDVGTATAPAAVTASKLIRKLHTISTAGGTRTYSLE
ncbi:type II secretion system protein [Sulfurovum sp. XGS-02]|uniref:type II secretion system protein n=1 Tax=Sulfurovum sp. XGS-02 TaxID=2925411 RepID=UPI00273A7198|nr:type II secretion system protein [Sulfurovum sp. XGS-02]